MLKSKLSNETLILGAGVTGLAAGLTSGLPVFEAADNPGGICASYYIQPGDTARLPHPPVDGEAYHFEIGGGHWIFGGDPAVLHFIKSLTPVKSYRRHSAVYFADDDLYVPYPLQNHLSYLGSTVAARALDEIINSPKRVPSTMADWLTQSFGPTLTKKFFGPFHQLYTAGLWTEIGPQDAYKSPVNVSLALQGAFGQTDAVGYNTTFVYPEAGLDGLARQMARRCNVQYSKQVTQIDLSRRELSFADGVTQPYEQLISTLPLNQILPLTNLTVDEPPAPHTSVLVLNIGAVRGQKCPADHWLYNPDAQSGFHRVGFYSNVDPLFLPRSARESNNRVSIYVERAYPGGQKPSKLEIDTYAAAVVQELQNWQFIEQPEVVDPTWIDVAYTWSLPGSRWREKTMELLIENGIFPVGRYGRWGFQGIADSIKDGFMVGGAFKP